MKKYDYLKHKMTYSFYVSLYSFLKQQRRKREEMHWVPFQFIWNPLQRNNLYSSLGFLALLSQKEQLQFSVYLSILFHLKVNKWLEEGSVTLWHIWLHTG